MVDFAAAGGMLLAEGHDHDEADLRAGLASALAEDRNQTQAQVHADLARLDETWYSDEGGFGHDCSLHQDVDKSLWSPHCGTFRPVTAVVDVSAPAKVQRAAKAVERP